MSKHKEEKKITSGQAAGIALSWIFGILFLLAGIGVLIQGNYILGILIILCSVIIIPFFSELLTKKLNFKIPGWVKIMLAVLIIIFITLVPTSPSNKTTQNTTQFNQSVTTNKILPYSNNYSQIVAPPQTQQQTPTSITDENFAQFNSEFWSLTDLQREEMWKKYEGKYIKWTFYVKNVDKDMFGTYTVLGNVEKPTEYTISSDVTVKFKDSEKEKLLQYNKGDLITVVGKLESYSETFLKFVYVVDGEVVKTEKMTYADEGKGSEACQMVTQSCNQGDGNACMILMQLRQDGSC